MHVVSLPWIDHNIKKIIRKRDKLYRLYKISFMESKYAEFNRATILYLEPSHRNRYTEISTIPIYSEGIEFEHSATQ